MVHDCIYKGLLQPILGHFSIDLSIFIKNSLERFNRKTRKSSKNLNENTAFSKFFPIPEFKSAKEELKEIEITEINPKKEIKAPLLEKEKELESEIPKPIIKQLSLPRKIITPNEINSLNIVIPAQYEFNEALQTIVETEIPDKKLFMEIGYDDKDSKLKSGKKKKHYRHFIDTELEKSRFMDKHTFDEFNITRGKRLAEENSFFSNKREGDYLHIFFFFFNHIICKIYSIHLKKK